MNIIDLTDILLQDRILPQIETEDKLERLPKWSTVYAFCLRVLRDKKMNFEECYQAVIDVWNNIPVCLVTTDMVGQETEVAFATGKEKILIPSCEQDESIEENELLTEMHIVDPLGVYVRRSTHDIHRRQVVFLWIDRIMKIAGKEKYDALLCYATMHQLVHAMMDMDVDSDVPLTECRNRLLMNASMGYFRNREEALTSALAVMFMVEFLSDSDQKYIVDYLKQQPKPYSQFSKMFDGGGKQSLLMRTSFWTVFKMRFDGKLETTEREIEEEVRIPFVIRNCEYQFLTSYMLPADITSIHNSFLHSFLGVESIVIPEGVESIKPFAFASCISLRELVLPASLVEVDGNAFDGCDGTVSITVNEPSLKFYSAGNCLMTKGSDVVVVGCKESKIPQVTSEIGVSAFSTNRYLTDITLPDNLYIIRDYAFSGTGLKKIIIPAGVQHVCERAFSDCAIEEILFLGSPCLHSQCFAHCKNLRVVRGIADKAIMAEEDVFFASGNSDGITFDVKGGIQFVKEV